MNAACRRIDLIGMPTDVHSSFLRGCAKAPTLIREALFSPHGNSASESGLELVRVGLDPNLAGTSAPPPLRGRVGRGVLAQTDKRRADTPAPYPLPARGRGGEPAAASGLPPAIALNDLGDLPLDEAPGDDERIHDAIMQSLKAGAIPISLGGDHSITYPILQAIAARHGPVDILHFDAHPDLYDELGGDRRSHASPFARIMEAGLASRLTQIGIRTLNRHQREQAARFGVEITEMKDFGRAPLPAFNKPLYISIDLDGFDPAFAPGVSHHEPGGLSVRDVVDILLSLDVPLLGADVVEYNPSRDINGVTAVLAAKLVKELAALGSI